MNRLKWVERKFHFDLPVGVFPSIVERLRGTPARLEELVRSFPAELLTERPEGAWSVKEQVGHLLDLDELHEGRLDDYDTGAATLRPADVENRKTHEAGHNSRPVEDLLAEFRAARTRFVEKLEAMDEVALARTALHPRLQQPMRVVDLAFFVAEHDDHHLVSVTELRRKLSF